MCLQCNRSAWPSYQSAQSPMCRRHGGDACVLGIVERATRCSWRRASEAHASYEVLDRSVLPEPIEAVGAKLGISHRVRDVAVAEVVLQRAGVDAIVGELEAAGVAQHVRMSRERKFGQFSSPADHFEEPGPRHRAAAFGVVDEAALEVLPSQLAQGPNFLAGERVRAIDTVLGPPYMDATAIEFDHVQVNSQSSLARSPWR